MVTKFGRLIAFILAFGTAVASAQLLLKHRYLEFYYSRLLEAVEKAKEMAPIHAQVPNARGIVGWRSHRIWLGVLVFFGLAALYGAGRLVATWLV